jgi:hypothetical protein
MRARKSVKYSLMNAHVQYGGRKPCRGGVPPLLSGAGDTIMTNPPDQPPRGLSIDGWAVLAALVVAALAAANVLPAVPW